MRWHLPLRAEVLRRLDDDQLATAIRELLLLESSDWLFMVARGVMVAEAEARLVRHAQRVAEACTGHLDSPSDLLRRVPSSALRAAFIL